MKQDRNQVKIRFKPELKDWVERQAKLKDRSQTWIINDLVQKAMAEEAAA